LYTKFFIAEKNRENLFHRLSEIKFSEEILFIFYLQYGHCTNNANIYKNNFTMLYS